MIIDEKTEKPKTTPNPKGMTEWTRLAFHDKTIISPIRGLSAVFCAIVYNHFIPTGFIALQLNSIKSIINR